MILRKKKTNFTIYLWFLEVVIYGIKNNFSIEFSKCNRKKQAKSGFFLRFCIARNNNNFIYNENNIYAHTVVLIEHKDFDHAPKRQFYIIFRRLYIPIPHVLCMMMTSIVIRYNSMFNIFCSFSVCLNIIFFLFFCLLFNISSLRYVSEFLCDQQYAKHQKELVLDLHLSIV